MVDAAAPLSKEILLPFQVNSAGGIGWTASYPEQVRQHVFSILGTAIGERVMRGDYGTHTISRVFQGINPALVSTIQDDFNKAMALYCPEASITQLETNSDPANGVLSMTVHFVISQSQSTDSATSIEIPVQ